MKKGILILAVLLIAALVVLNIFSNNVGKAIASGIEVAGTEILKTPVKMENISVSPLSGSAHIEGFSVGNPEGFKAENIFSVSSLQVKLDLGSVLSDHIKIERIYIKDPQIAYEKKLGTDNIKELLKNVESAASTSEKSEESEDKPSKKIEIGELVIEGAQVDIKALGMGLKTKVPNIVLHDIGKGSKAMDAVKVIQYIVSSILKEIIGSVTNVLSSGGNLGVQGVEGAANAVTNMLGVGGDAGKELSKGATNLLNGLLKKKE